MFCDFNKIKNIIKCKVCSSLVTEEPKILPCGETICSMCSNYEIEIVKNEFDCSVCKKKHEMPKEGLPINKSLLEILLTQPVEVSRGEPAKLLSNSLIEIQKRITHLTNSIENGVDNLKENCFDLKSDVQLVTETAIQMINDFNEKFINKIDDYEKESTKACNENINNNKEFVQTLDKLKSFHNKWTNYLAMPQISDHIITETHKQADEMIKLAENVLVKQDNNIPQLKFIKNDLKLNLNENILGKFILDVRSSVSYAKMVNSNVMAANITRMRSKILSDLQFKELINLCRFAQNKAWNLIYRATQNGFGSNNFHRNCDEKLNTLIIIKSRNGNVFGGYTTQDWSGDGILILLFVII